MTEFKKLKPGEVLSETQYYKVQKIAGNKVQLKNDFGEDIVVDSNYVDKCLTSAEQAPKETFVNKTEAANLLLANPYVVMTACYKKQVKEADVVKQILDAYAGSTPKSIEAVIKQAVKAGLQGEERVIVGRHMGTQDDFGRVNFVDMNLDKGVKPDYDARLRLVDPRTLNWLILRGTKYIVK